MQVQTLRLSINLRAMQAPDADPEVQQQWADELLRFGNGTNYEDEENKLIGLPGLILLKFLSFLFYFFLI